MLSCPSCGGNVKFDIPSQKLSCEYCHEKFDPYAFDHKKSDAGESRVNEGEYEVTIFSCPQCGGEILSTDNAAAGFCSFCGASTILYSRISHEKRPNFIIPFKKTKEDCKQAYAELMKRAIYAPKELKDPAYIDGFRGIYMPYWAFYVTQQGHISVPATKKYRRGDYIYTDHYQLEGDLDAYYKGLSYDASSSFADNISETLAPYDLKGMKGFTPGYLSGFYADTADVDSLIYQPEAEKTAAMESIRQIGHTKEFSGFHIEKDRAAKFLPTRTETVDRTMFPVWFMSYRKNYRVAYVTVNGQTGKIVADIPIDYKKYILGSIITSIPLFLLFSFFTLLPKVLVGTTFFLALLALILYASENSRIKKKDSGAGDRGLQYALMRHTACQPPGYFEKKSYVGYVSSIAAMIVCALVLLLHPVFDLYYYIAAVVGLIAVGLCIWDIIRRYNILSTRRLPQFNKQGGDDRA